LSFITMEEWLQKIDFESYRFIQVRTYVRTYVSAIQQR